MNITRKTALTALAILLIGVSLIVFFHSNHEKQKKENSLQSLKERYLADLTDSGRDISITPFRNALSSNGRFKDLSYTEKAENPRETVQHLERLEVLAKAYRSKHHAGYLNPSLLEDIQTGLDYWNAHPVKAENWWWNRLRMPMILSNLLFLMEDDLSEETKQDSLRLLKSYTAAEAPPLKGVNLVEAEKITFITGLLEDDSSKIQEAVSSIQYTLQASSIGIQPDMTFHQHEQSVQTGTYGIRYALETAGLLAMVHETDWSFRNEDYQMLSHFILDGIQWFITGDTIDYTSLGRGITRQNNQLNDVAAAARIMEKLPTGRKDDFRRMIDRLEGKRPPFTGNKAYNTSGLMVHHQKNAYSSVRILPENMKSSEPYYNGEGINSRHLADGATLFYLKGNGYAGIFPVWDWRKIPGTTVVHGGENTEPRSGKKNETIMLSDGEHGLTAMDTDQNDLSAKKTWFFFGDTIAALGTDIQSSSKQPAVTTVDQRIWNQPVETSETNILNHSTHKTISKPSWIYHNGIGYLFPGDNDRIHLMLNKREASWKKINERYDEKAAANEKVLGLWINHGAKPENSRYQYIVVPGVSKEAFHSMRSESPLHIISNTGEIQAVQSKKLQVTQAVFWQAGTLKTQEGLHIRINQPAALQLKKEGTSWNIQAQRADDTKEKLKITVQKTSDGRKQTLLEKEGVKENVQGTFEY